MKNFAIIGYGFRIRSLVKLLIETNSELNLVSIYDSEWTEIKSELELKPEIQLLGGSSLETFFEDLEKEKVELVMIGSINSEHFQHLKSIYEKFPKMKIFCEKPLVTTLSDLERLTEMVKLKSLNLATGFVLRYSPFFRKIKELIDTGIVGDVCNINANECLYYGHGAFINQNWRRHHNLSGGHVNEKCIHMIDLLNYYVEGRCKFIEADGSTFFWREENKKYLPQLKAFHDDDPNLLHKFEIREDVDSYQTEDRDVCDTCSAILTYPKTLVTFNCTTYSPNSSRRIEIHGTLGRIIAEWENDSASIRITNKGFGKREMKGHPSQSFIIQYNGVECHGGGDQLIVNGLINYVLNDQPMTPRIEEALEANRITLEIEAKIKERVELRKILTVLGNYP